MNLVLVSAILLAYISVAEPVRQFPSELQRSVDLLQLYDRGRHLCRGDDGREPDVATLAGDVCYCDSYCVTYGDCCLDYDSGSQPIRNDDFSCDRIGSSPRYYYTKSTCTNSTWASRCDGDLERPWSILHEPVFVDGVLYRNEYCARCHIPEAELKENRYRWQRAANWKPRVPPLPKVDGKFSVRKLFKGHNWFYNKTSRQYHIFYKKEYYTMTVEIGEFHWTNFSDVFNTSLCPTFPTINACEGESTQMSRLCAAYTAYVYTAQNGSITVYRNAHCALCYNVSIEALTVGLPAPPKDRPRIVGDFIPISDVDCPPGHATVMGSHCQPVLCDLGLVWDGLQCRTEDGRAGCFILMLRVEWVRFLDLDHVLWISTEKIFPDYTNITDYSGIVTHVRVCTTTPITNPITPAIEWIAEFCLISSCVCLALQIIVYLVLPSTRSSRPGRIIILLSFSMLCGHVAFLRKDDFEPGQLRCELTAIFAHFFYISSFFWMFVMALDSCRCLAQDVLSGPDTHHLMRRYFLLAMAGSVGVVLCSFAIGRLLPASRFAPAYGVEVCWFGNRDGFLAFFALPTLLIIGTNLSLFIYTALRIRSVQRRVNRTPARASAPNGAPATNLTTELFRVRIYLRLAAIVGLTWLFGVLSFVADSEAGHSVMTYLFFILGFVQGVFVFVGFTCKPTILKELRQLLANEKDPSRATARSESAGRETTSVAENYTQDLKRFTPLLSVQVDADPRD